MAKRKVAQTEEVAQQVQETYHAPATPFWEKYQKELLYALGGLALVVLGWWGYKTLIVEPKQKEAVAAMWKAQRLFERDSFQVALNGDGLETPGFLSVIDQYGGTAAGNLAKYYAGVCYLQSNDIDNAISQIEDFDADGDVMPILKYGVLGDCYSEKKEYDKALGLYEKAVDAGNNDALASAYLKKLGLLYEHQGNKEAAVKAYERLRRDFPNQNSADWRDIEKYIYRAGGGQ